MSTDEYTCVVLPYQTAGMFVVVILLTSAWPAMIDSTAAKPWKYLNLVCCRLLIYFLELVLKGSRDLLQVTLCSVILAEKVLIVWQWSRVNLQPLNQKTCFLISGIINVHCEERKWNMCLEHLWIHAPSLLATAAWESSFVWVLLSHTHNFDLLFY